MDKVIGSAAQAVADIRSGSSLAVGGFGVCGVPATLIDALLEAGATDLEIVSNNCGLDDFGLGLLLRRGRIRRAVSSYVGENAEFARRYLTGELELELTPQGTLAERLRAGGAGIPAFYTRAGAGTAIADGGMPWRYAPDGSVAVSSPAKETRMFNGTAYVLEAAIRCDFALVRAAVADRRGNLSFHESARNFNPLCAMAGAMAIAEGETIVDELPPDRIDLPGVFVQRVVQADSRPKLIERRTIRKRGSEV
jgi:3-oxoacid CoA-transferase subunit A